MPSTPTGESLGGKPYSLTLDIPGLPRTQTGTTHWRIRAAERKEYHEKVGWEIQRLGGRKILPPEPLKSARLRIIRFSTTQADYDNLVIAAKPIIDGLKVAGVIEDDKPSVIGFPIYAWEKTGKGKGFTRVEVTILKEMPWCQKCGEIGVVLAELPLDVAANHKDATERTLLAWWSLKKIRKILDSP